MNIKRTARRAVLFIRVIYKIYLNPTEKNGNFGELTSRSRFDKITPSFKAAMRQLSERQTRYMGIVWFLSQKQIEAD